MFSVMVTDPPLCLCCNYRPQKRAKPLTLPATPVVAKIGVAFLAFVPIKEKKRGKKKKKKKEKKGKKKKADHDQSK